MDTRASGLPAASAQTEVTSSAELQGHGQALAHPAGRVPHEYSTPSGLLCTFWLLHPRGPLPLDLPFFPPVRTHGGARKAGPAGVYPDRLHLFAVSRVVDVSPPQGPGLLPGAYWEGASGRAAT